MQTRLHAPKPVDYTNCIFCSLFFSAGLSVIDCNFVGLQEEKTAAETETWPL